MLNIDEQVTTLFYWFLKFRYCPTCHKAWVHHKDGDGNSEAWDHLANFIARKVIEQNGGKPSKTAAKKSAASAKAAVATKPAARPKAAKAVPAAKGSAARPTARRTAK